MTKRLFDTSLLRFIHFLTLTQKYLSPGEMAQAYSEHIGKSITEKTIRRWIKCFKKNFAFDFRYWPEPRYEKFGLMRALVILESNRNIASVLPYKTYAAICLNLKDIKNHYLLDYAFPSEQRTNFENIWQFAGKIGLAENYEIIYHAGTVVSYAPHHKILNSRGYVEINDDFDVTQAIELLRKELQSTQQPKPESFILRNPIAVPLMLEMRWNYHAAKTVLRTLKTKLRRALWSYVPNIKKKSDGALLQHLQFISGELQNNFSRHFRQMRVEYEPTYSNENISIFAVVKLNDVGKLPELVARISKHALTTNVRLPVKGSSVVVLYIATSNREATHIQSDILPNYIDKNFDNKLFWLNYDASARELWRKSDMKTINEVMFKPAYWDLFDPKTCTWKWEQEKYLKELERLAKANV